MEGKKGSIGLLNLVLAAVSRQSDEKSNRQTARCRHCFVTAAAEIRLIVACGGGQLSLLGGPLTGTSFLARDSIQDQNVCLPFVSVTAFGVHGLELREENTRIYATKMHWCWVSDATEKIHLQACLKL